MSPSSLSEILYKTLQAICDVLLDNGTYMILNHFFYVINDYIHNFWAIFIIFQKDPHKFNSELWIILGYSFW